MVIKNWNKVNLTSQGLLQNRDLPRVHTPETDLIEGVANTHPDHMTDIRVLAVTVIEIRVLAVTAIETQVLEVTEIQEVIETQKVTEIQEVTREAPAILRTNILQEAITKLVLMEAMEATEPVVLMSRQ